MMAVVLLLAAGGLALLVWLLATLRKHLWLLTAGSARTRRSPFRTIFSPAPTQLVTEQSERDKVLKRNFSADKIPDSLDAIVIGELMTFAYTCSIIFIHSYISCKPAHACM